MPWLLLDVGNTAIKWRLAGAEGLMDGGGFVSDVPSLCEDVGMQHWSVVGLASVGGDLVDSELIAALAGLNEAKVRQAVSQSTFLGLVNSYPHPNRMGVDRWLAMLAAHHHNDGALCVIDAGTAVTLDLLSAEGVHRGGYILPGAEIMGRALSIYTGRIHVDILDHPTFAPGDDTVACVSAGGWRAVMGALQSVLSDYPEHRALLTGGSALTLLDLGLTATYIPDLVMEGLRLWLSQTLDDEGR